MPALFHQCMSAATWERMPAEVRHCLGLPRGLAIITAKAVRDDKKQRARITRKGIEAAAELAQLALQGAELKEREAREAQERSQLLHPSDLR